MTAQRSLRFDGELNLRIEGLFENRCWGEMAFMIITGYDEPMMEVEAGRYGAEFVRKPIRPAEFLESVARALNSVRRKLTYDLYYFHHQSPCLDLGIMLATAGKMLRIPFGIFRTVFRIPEAEEGEPLSSEAP